MTGPYPIRYLRTAEKDLTEIFDYMQRDKPAACLNSQSSMKNDQCPMINAQSPNAFLTFRARASGVKGF